MAPFSKHITQPEGVRCLERSKFTPPLNWRRFCLTLSGGYVDPLHTELEVLGSISLLSSFACIFLTSKAQVLCRSFLFNPLWSKHRFVFSMSIWNLSKVRLRE
jgi:hypothetical protein